jgi:hypothetical protein
LTPFAAVSALAVGQNPPLGFFFAAYEPESPFVTVLEFWLDCTAVAVDEVELDDDTDEDEFVLCTVFL